MTQHGEVADMLAAYAETDLLCHRADSPDTPVRSAASTAGIRCSIGRGAFRRPSSRDLRHLPIEQPKPALQRLSEAVHGTDAFRLTALHDLVGLTGSLVLGLAVAHGRLDTDEAWR
jgi:chaperone required for assembly of F1-ATPase